MCPHALFSQARSHMMITSYIITCSEGIQSAVSAIILQVEEKL